MKFIKNQNIPHRNCIAVVGKDDDCKKSSGIVEMSLKGLYSLREKISRVRKADKRLIPVLGIVVSIVALVIVFNMNFSFAYRAYMGATELGYVPSRKCVANCMDNINSEFAQYVSGEDIVGGEVIYIPSVIRKGKFTPEFDVEESIKSTSDVMVKAHAVEVDGLAVAALESEESARGILDEITSLYKTDENSEVSFKEDVRVIYEYVPASICLNPEVVKLRLLGERMLTDYVVVDNTITIKDFASANGIDESQLKKLNPNLGDTIEPSVEVAVLRTEKILTVITADTVTYEREIPFEEKVSEDSHMYEGAEKLVQIGKNGLEEVTEKIELENGNVVNRVVVRTEVKAEPIVQMRSVGTKYRPSDVGTGVFIRPYSGSISSRFGTRSDNHTGVDFQGRTGDPVVAADSGTVISAKWANGYGKLVKIDHNNGYITYYAHCNDIYVSEGDVVQKGDVIAALGSTGNSTGPHVHFEIRYNGEHQDPLNYVQ